jgi:hypothetical protein
MRIPRLALLALSIAATGAFAQTTAAPPSTDYSNPRAWACRPDRLAACDVDLSTTVLGRDGRVTIERARPDPKAPVDCFYVYPTVSTDTTTNSDLVPDAAERNVVRLQFARFGSKCRLFAPMYRQLTLAAMGRANAAGIESPDFLGVGYEDVRAAWHYYLAHDNGNRGIVLIGHSQGTSILAELIRREIEGTPMQSRLVSALLIGAPGGILVSRGRDAGGTFAHMPLCRAATETGCVVAYSAFRVTAPPAANHALRAVGRFDTRRGVYQSRGARRRRGRPRRLFRRDRRNCPAARAPGSVDRWRTTHCDAHGACGGAVEGAVQVQRVRLVSRGVGRARS